MPFFGLGKPNIEKMLQKRDVKALCTALSHKDRKVRINAIYALGKIGDKRAIEPLIAALKDKHMLVRNSAADTLGKIGDRRAVEPLTSVLNDKYLNVREEAAKALGMIGDERAMERGVEPTKIVFSQTDFGSAQKFICSECGEEIPNAVQYEPPDLTMRCSGIARKCSCGWTCCFRCDPTYNQPENGHECPQCGKFHRGWVRWDPHRNMVDRSGWIQIDGEPDYWFKGGLWEVWKKDRESDRWVTIRSAVVKRLKLSDVEKG